MKLSPARYNRFLGGLAQSVLWRHGHECPCRDPHSGAPAHDCRVCQNGIVWQPEVCAHLALSGQKVQQTWARMGRYENGDVVCTLPSNSKVYAAGQFDRIVFVDSTVPFSVTRVNDGVQRLDFNPAKIERVFWLNPAKSAITEGRVPSIRDDGQLTWSSGGPPAGAQYTVTGRKHPEYFVFFDFPQDRAHHGGEPLPRKVVLRNFDLFRRGS